MLSALSVSPDGSHLIRDGRPFPLVADTAWSAFADATDADWVHYVARRRQQGFTAVAISVLPILHDRTVGTASRSPFAVREDGGFDFTAPDAAYFENARRMVETVTAAGMVPILVALWCNYAPGTWGSDLTPWGIMSDEERRAHISLVIRSFAEFQPVIAVSGDERFSTDAAIEAYVDALGQVAREAPALLTTMHTTPDAVVPEVIADSPDLDFFVYQSGHHADQQHLCWELAELYRSRSIRKPVINLEPVYEQHGHGFGAGRFTEIDVRRAIWWSILGGASAGIGYGAHGIWQWHREGGQFNNTAFSLEPFPWQSALGFPGADDAGLAGRLIETHALHRLGARQDLLVGVPDGRAAIVRAAASESGDLVAVYLPYATAVTVAGDLGDATVTAWDLRARRPLRPELTVAGGVTTIALPDVLGDVLYLFERSPR